MKLNTIKLINFRNYTKQNLEFSPHLNFIIGANGSGKTNIIEAIYMLGVTKTYKSIKEDHLVNRAKDHFLIKGEVKISDNVGLSLYYDKANKLAMIDEQKVPKLSDYIGNLKVVLFSPEDLNLIKGNPGTRRKFINLEIGQLDQNYLKLVHEYNGVLKNRNEYLKMAANKNQVDGLYIETINEQLAELGSKIYKQRFEFVDKINQELDNIFKSFHGNGELVMKYETNIGITDALNSKETLLEKLNNSLQQDIFKASTSHGPHRDDFSLYLDDENIKNDASQGQIRLAILGLKCAETLLIKEVTGEYPIILLDDLFSELDKEKVKNILKFINKEMQIIITTTDLDEIPKNLLKNSKIFEIIKSNDKIEVLTRKEEENE